MHEIFNNHHNTFDTLEVNKNVVVYSALKSFYHSVKSQGFVVRYVDNGVERYILNGEEYSVDAGTYLLSNATSEGSIEVDSKKQVMGICLNITPALLCEIAATKRRPDTTVSDNELGTFFSSASFLDNKYTARQTHLGKFLLDFNTHIQQNPFNTIELNSEFFYAVSEKIIDDQLPVFKQLQSIPSIKSATKNMLYKHINKGKEYIDTFFHTPLTIEKVAKEACMSEYHFFRLFKRVLGISPHQYILKKRLEYAQTILKQDKTAVSFAAFDAGFSDIYAFSKAFKKHFGYTPSSLLK